MPWVSDKQRKYMFANHPKVAARMQKHSKVSDKEYKHHKYSKKGK